jgi:ubiquinone/menaquinone biosynthesis C-methylase UbiE
MSSSGATPDFGARAADYDALRPQDDAWWARFDVLVELADLRNRHVLDVGCGTGLLAEALVERVGATVTGVEPSDGMRTVAESRLGGGVEVLPGSAEALPLRDATFERVVFSLVIHLVDRDRALAEAYRVLAPGGKVGVVTFADVHFDTYWASSYFPSIRDIDRARFPTEGQLVAELSEAGFTRCECRHLTSRQTISREHALERIRGRHISTFDLLDAEELRSGTERAERELPDVIDQRLEQLIVAATRERT